MRRREGREKDKTKPAHLQLIASFETEKVSREEGRVENDIEKNEKSDGERVGGRGRGRKEGEKGGIKNDSREHVGIDSVLEMIYQLGQLPIYKRTND